MLKYSEFFGTSFIINDWHILFHFCFYANEKRTFWWRFYQTYVSFLIIKQFYSVQNFKLNNKQSTVFVDRLLFWHYWISKTHISESNKKCCSEINNSWKKDHRIVKRFEVHYKANFEIFPIQKFLKFVKNSTSTVWKKLTTWYIYPSSRKHNHKTCYFDQI